MATEASRERRLGVFSITEETLHELFRGAWVRCSGLPEGAEILGVSANFESRSIRVMVAHASLRSVQEGIVAPLMGELELHNTVAEDLEGSIERLSSHPDDIYVRDYQNDHWGNFALSELPAASAVRHAVRLARAAIVRNTPPEEAR